MPLTPEEEQEYQRLGTKLGFLGNAGAAPAEDDYGALGFAGRTAANFFPGALEKIIQPAQTLLGMGDEMSAIPNFFDVRAPRNIKEHIIGGAGEIAEYLPGIIATEGAAAAGLARLGMAAPRAAGAIEAGAALAPSRAARIAASGIGMGLPMAPHGAETAGVQGGVGALQRAAMDWGWKGKVAAGIIGGGAGYYEGAKGPQGTPTQGAIFGALNLLAPTVIDPIVNKMTGYKPYQTGGEPIPGQPASTPNALLGPEGHMDAAFQQMNPAQRQAHIEAVMGRSEPAPYAPDPFNPVQTTDGRFRNPIDVGQMTRPGGGGINWTSESGLPVSGLPDQVQLPGQNAYDIFAGLQKQPPMGPMDIFSPGERSHFASGDRTVQGAPLTVAEAGQRRLLNDRRAALTANEQAAFTRSLTNRAAGVQQDIHDLFPFGLDPVRPFDPTMVITERSGTSADIYGGQTGLFDIMGHGRGVQAPAPSQAAFTPAEAQARAQFTAKQHAAAAAPKPETRAAAPVKAEPLTITEPKKTSGIHAIRPSINVGDRRVIGNVGETHQDILNRHLAEHPDDADALLNFDTPENPNYFIDKGGNRITREQLQKTYGIRDSQGLREAQKKSGAPPPKSEPVEPAAAPAQPKFREVEEGIEYEQMGEDFQISDDLWDRISPEAEGGGLLSAPEAARRLKSLGYTNVEGKWTSGDKAGQTFKFDDLLKEPIAPTQSDARPRVQIQGRYGWEEAVIIGKEGDVLHVQTLGTDPIFGVRTTSVYESDTLPVAGLQKPASGGTVPFKDVESVPLRMEERLRELEGEQHFNPDEEEFSDEMVEEAINRLALPKERRAARAKWEYMKIEEQYGGSYGSGEPNKYAYIFAHEGGSATERSSPQQYFDDLLSKQAQLLQYKLAVQGGTGHQGYKDYWHQSAAAISEWKKQGTDLKQWMKETQKYLKPDEVAPRLTENIVRRQRVIAALQKLTPEERAHTIPGFDGPYNPHVLKILNDHSLHLHDARVRSVEAEIAYQQSRLPKQEGESLGSMIEGSGPAKVSKTLKGRDKTILSIEEGLKLIPDEPRAILSEILHQANVAVGRELDIHFERGAKGVKGSMYIDSGRIGVNLHWLNGIVRNWGKMSPDTQAKALMKATALFGHEITHVVHRYAEKSGMAVNGMGVTEAIVQQVESMSPSQRKYVAEQILKAKGEGNVSDRVKNYLSGDFDQIKEWYTKRRGRELSDQEVKQLAAGEVMAEIGTIELVKRMNVSGLPQGFRDIVDRFKQILINVVHWFTSKGHNSDIAALQNLQSIASKMYDHFKLADEPGLAKAFPTSGTWKAPPVVNPFSSGTPPPGTAGSTVPTAPTVEVVNGPLLKTEMLRLGIRGAVGATIGAFAGPAIAPNQITTAEGIILGGIAGIFGPAVAKKLLSGNFADEAAAAFKAHPKNPLKALGHIMGGGKTLQELGIEGRHGWTGQSSAMAKWVRWFEHEFDLGLDPAQKAISEEARGLGSMQLAIVSDALDKVRWYKPSPTMIDAVNSYFEGKITKTDFQALLTSPQLQNYGNFIMAAREGMTTLSRMFAAGLPRSAFKNHVIDTSEKYLGKFYSAYTEGKFNMEHFDKAKQDLMKKYGYSDQISDELLHEYMREVQSNRKMYSTGRRGESGEKYDTSTLMRRMATEEEIEGQMVVVGGLEYNKFGKDYQKEFAKLEWMQDHKITDNWRLWLGEYTNPVERMMYTFQKIHPSAISGHAFDLLDTRVHTNGNKFSYTDKELVSTRELIQSEISSGKVVGEELAGLQNRLKELSGYGPVPEGAAYGKLRGKWVDRYTRDSLNTYSTPYKWMEQPIIRSLAEFNNLVKIAHTALTPLTVWRNYLSMPFMGLIARANWGDVAGAFKEIHFNRGEDYRLMLRRHIIGADFSTQELSKGPGTVFAGYMDADIATKVGKSLWRLILKNYQQPDMLVRAGAFISARKRFAQELLETGLETVDANQVATHYRPANLTEAMEHATVIDKAVEFTNRYTMNYSTVPNIVKAGRQLPFINMFISYTSEMTRILKNLTEDVIAPGPNSAGRMHAITTLGAMAAIPTIMTAMGKDQLSEKDRADWDRVEKLSPSYNRSRFRIPYKRDEQGRFHYFDITNLLPADNYSQMIKAFSSGDSEAFWAANPLVSLQNTPLLNMATEQITGEDIRTGQTIQGFGRVREILKEVLPPIIPPGYEGQRLIRAFSSNVEGELGLTNMKTGVQYKPSDIVSNYITGMRFGNVMLSTVQRQAISESKQLIAEQQQLLRETTNMNVDPFRRARAQEIYNKAVEQIIMRLHEKMPAPK